MLDKAKEVLQLEAEAILALIPRLNDNFEKAAEMMFACQGRIVVTGMGKSGIVGHKIAATLASTGTPAFFLHPAEGIHGDLGMVTMQDIVLAISNSGETGEVLQILPSIRRIGAKIISITGNAQSTLAKNSDIALDAAVEHEACPFNLAPTTSTTATLALGDAIAMTLMYMNKFTPTEFAVFHPGGSLGRRLLLTVEGVMHKAEELPTISPEQTVQEALFVITDKGLGATVVVDERERLVGLLTDGDIRRGLAKGLEFIKRPVKEMMTKTPKTIRPHKLAAEALHIMEHNQPRPITVLPVVDAELKVCGLIHMTDLLKKGVI